MSWYQRIQQAKVGGAGGIPPAPGDYIFQVLEVREHQGQGGGAYFIIVLMVLQSSHPDHPPGSQRSQVIRLDVDFKDSPLGDIKAFAAAVLGLDPRDPRVDQEITPQVIAGILHPQQPVAGHVLAANVWLKMPGRRSRPGAQPFTKYTWKPILENGAPKRLPMPQGYVPQAQLQAQAPQGGGFGGGGFGHPQQGGGFGQPQGPGSTQWGGQAPTFGGGQFGGGQQGGGYQAPAPQPAQPNFAQQAGWGQGQPQLPNFAQPQQPQHQQAPAPQPAPQSAQFGGAAAPQPMTFPWQAGAPQAPAAPQPPQFPPAGWQAHPDPAAKGWFWDGKPHGQVLNEADLRTLMATGRA